MIRLVRNFLVVLVVAGGGVASEARLDAEGLRPMLVSHDPAPAILSSESVGHVSPPEQEFASTVTSGVQNEAELIIHSTAELVGAVADLRMELESIRTELFAAREREAPSDVKSPSMRADACFACAVRPEWQRLPLGLIAGFQVEKVLCPTPPEQNGAQADSQRSERCTNGAMFSAQVSSALARPLSSLERLSCSYLTRTLAVDAECPQRIGAFYDCTSQCLS